MDSKVVNRSRGISRLADWLMQLRRPVGRSNINLVSHAETHQRVHAMSQNSNNTIQVLSQKEKLWKFYQQHRHDSPLDHEDAVNPLIRTFGTMLSDECCDELAILTGTRVDNRETHDSHSSDESAIFENLAMLLCNEDIFIPNPPR